ncbi:four helix bundle protein [Candidatus Kaiserbacteria bacterium]|nr:four helix bundle protein [Candidatus Kaiserbacteria bacterium]
MQQQFVPVVSKLKDAYLIWQSFLPHVAKARRQTIAQRIDSELLETLAHSFRAEYLKGERKISSLEAAIARLDLAKFFLIIAWEMSVLTDAQYARISEYLIEASKMLVGWKNYIEKKTRHIPES